MGQSYEIKRLLNSAGAVPSGSLTTTTLVVELGQLESDAILESLTVAMSAIVTAASVSMRLTADAAGDIGVTPGQTDGATQSIQVGKATADDGTVVFNFGQTAHPPHPAQTGNLIYAAITVDAGTATADSISLAYGRWL